MASTESASNNQILLERNKNKENSEELPKRPEPVTPLINPIFGYNNSTNIKKTFESNISDKNKINEERYNSSCSLRSHQEYNTSNIRFFPPRFPGLGIPYIFSQSFQPMNSFKEPNNPLRLDANNFNFHYFLTGENDENYKKEDAQSKNISNIFNNFNKNLENKWTNTKTQNLNLNMNIINNKIETQLPISKIDEKSENQKDNNANSNSGTKFFTNHNYGYKCSCSKTQCNRKYCECYNSGNYCVDCNCKNCNNKPPQNSYTNKRPTDDQSKLKKEKVICTCTKSGCNKNYCECFKSGQKCTVLCRCIGCENNDQIQVKKYNNNYQCNLANSIYIVKNIIYEENVNRKREKREDLLFGEDAAPIRKCDFIGNYKKRKREENKNEEDEKIYNHNKTKKLESSDDINLFNDSLFDKNGKVILRHINLIQI